MNRDEKLVKFYDVMGSNCILFEGIHVLGLFTGRQIVMKVHSQTLMAMKSGCKIYTQKCYVTLEWPLMLHFKHRLCCPQFVQCALRK